MESKRPQPEQLLEVAEREEQRRHRGRLKIYFGAAPGVGKTYAMLELAQARRREGVDVAVGWIETHGRRETAELLRGLEVIPPREVEYRGVVLREFDLDRTLARAPKLVLIDELAHTNAAGSRHARRWQDVEELLAAGIDVLSTLNVQHVESLNDVVSQLTGVRVRETVPDRMFDEADDVELVDLPADELLRRLTEGKVYVPAQAERAVQHFFRKENLLALRELALRRTAERVDAQSDEFRRSQGLFSGLTVGERVLAIVDSSALAANIVRAACRTAARARAPWMALAVETPELERAAPELRQARDDALELARRLGGETLIVRGERVADEVLAVARERRVTRVLAARPPASLVAGWRQLSLLMRLVREAGPFELTVTAGEAEPSPMPRAPRPARSHEPLHFVVAVAAVLASTGLCWILGDVLAMADQVMVYLLGVLLVASRLPRVPSVLAAVLSVAALDFFFVPPFFTFAVADLRHGLSFVVMLSVGLIVSTYTVRLREQALAAQQRERRTAALYAMSRQMVIETGVGAIASTALQHVRETVAVECFILLAGRSGQLAPCGGEGTWVVKDERELAAARWTHENGRLSGMGTDTLPGTACLYIPMVGTGGHLGVFGLELRKRGRELSSFDWQTVETFVAQTALALERALLVERTANAQVQMEAEKARSELLSAVTHDVRTPLTGILGAADTLLEHGATLDEATRLRLLRGIHDDAEHLTRLVGDLLDLTRIESGALRVQKSPCPIDEVVDSALDRCAPRLAGREVVRELPAEVLVVPLDAVLFEQVLLNLLENACKYSPEGAPILVRGRAADGALVLEVCDRGRGIPDGELERIFERFYRAEDGERTGGTGLGLTICRAIARAHGGTIRARQRDGGGTCMEVRVPLVAKERGA